MAVSSQQRHGSDDIHQRTRSRGWDGQALPMVSGVPGQGGGSEAGLDLVRAWQMLRRHLRLALLVAAVITLAAALVITRLPDRYTAQALIALNDRPGKIAELQSPTENLLSHTQSDLSVVKTETDILTAEPVLRRVAETLNLAHDRVFMGEPAGPGLKQRLGEWLAGHSTELPAALRPWVPDLRATAAHRPDGDPLAAVVERLGRMITVVNDGGSYAIRVSVTADGPQLAASIANALVAAYLDSQRTRQAETRKAASEWLASRLRELRTSTLKADEAVEQFRARNLLGRTDAPSLLDVKLSQINGELIQATVRLSRAQANLAEIDGASRRGAGAGASIPVLASPTIQTLRQQESEILVQRSALARQYGPRHPAVAAIDAQLAAVHAKIQLEVDRIVASLRGEVNAAKGEVANLQDQLTKLEGNVGREADAQVQLAGLEREARASREVYSQFLQQFTTTLAQEAGQEPDARLVAAARPPVEPSGPRRKVLLVGAALGGLLIGTALALVVGIRRGGFGGPQPLENATGVPVLEMIPELKRRELKQLLVQGRLAEVANPIRSLAYTLDRRLAQPGGVILLTSSVAGEGKSLLSLTLARALAQSGRRTLLIELDLWRPSLRGHLRRLSMKVGEQSVAGLPISIEPTSGLQVALAHPAPPEAQRSGVIEQALAELDGLSERYDIILLDAPPVLVVPDVLPAAARADTTLLLVRFEGPDTATVQAALHKLTSVGAQVAGTVLSRVDRLNYQRYGYGALTYTRPG